MTVRTKKRTPLRPRFWLALGGILLVLMTAEWRLCRAVPAVSAVCRTAAQAVSAVGIDMHLGIDSHLSQALGIFQRVDGIDPVIVKGMPDKRSGSSLIGDEIGT